MAEQEEAVARFQEVTDCADPTFAASFLQVRTPPNLRRVCMSCSPIQPPPPYWPVQAHGWDLESSVEAFLTGDSSDARCVVLVLCVPAVAVYSRCVCGWLVGCRKRAA